MLNQVVIVGRLVSMSSIEKTNSADEYYNLKLAVNRPYRNSDGVYITDFVNFRLSSPIATNVSEYIQEGNLIGIKGHVQECSNEHSGIVLVGEKVTILAQEKLNVQAHDDNEYQKDTVEM